MAQAKKQSQNSHDQALEMRMRDVLDGMHEMACYISYKTIDESFEILSIEHPPEQDPVVNAQRATVHDLVAMQKQLQLKNGPVNPAKIERLTHTKRRSKNLYVDIADYLIIREQQGFT